MKPEAGFKFQVGRVGTAQDTTKFTSIWFVKKEDICGRKVMNFYEKNEIYIREALKRTCTWQKGSKNIQTTKSLK